MKAFKIIREFFNELDKIYTNMFNAVFEWLLCLNEPGNIRSMYCTSSYQMTPGGVIVNMDE